MKQIERNRLLILLGIVVFTVFFGIGSLPLMDPDEPVYAQTAREMLMAGDYLSPRIFGAFWYDKPPMYYWLVAASFKLFGDGEFAARFPSALMATATALVLYFSVTQIFNERAGFWSALVLTSCVEFFYLGKAAVTDTTLLFFLTGALLAFLHKRYWCMYVCMALATLTKGPIGLLFPGAVIFLYLLFMGQLREILRMHVIRGLLLYLLLTAPWYYAMYTVHGMVFLQTFIGFHNLVRFTTPEHADLVSIWFYLPVLVLGLFPWTGLLLPAVKASITDSRIDDMRNLMFMHVWWLFILLFFTVCKTKLLSYILPAFPALAVIIGWYLAHLQQSQRHNSRFWGWSCATALLCVLLAAVWTMGGLKLPELALGSMVLGVLTLLIGCAVVFALCYYRDVRLAALLHGLLGIVTMLVFFMFLLPVIADRFSMKTMSGVYQERCIPDTPVYVEKFLRPGFMYYAGKAGIEMVMETGGFAEALHTEGHKYLLVRGGEYRAQLRHSEKPETLSELASIGDIYLLEQD